MPKVLLIDDEELVRETVADSLEDLKLEILQASNGNEALETLKTQTPDLIISDYRMPGLDGLEVLRVMREREIVVPVIWLTGEADEQIFREAWGLGIFDFFQKPFEMDALRQSVSDALRMGAQAQPFRGAFLKENSFWELKVILRPELARRMVEICQKENRSITTIINNLLSERYLK